MPLPNIEHQDLAGALTAILMFTHGFDGLGQVFPGVNVSDRSDHLSENYRCSDVAVYLSETPAERRNAYWLGDPDLAIEVVIHDDITRDIFAFYAKVGSRELLILDRDTRPLALYALDPAAGALLSVGRS